MSPSFHDASIAIVRSPLTRVFALYFVASFSSQLLEIPLVRLLESAICNRHFHHELSASDRGVKEDLWKISPVQDKLSNVMGWKVCFDAIPGTFLLSTFGWRYNKASCII